MWPFSLYALEGHEECVRLNVRNKEVNLSVRTDEVFLAHG